MLTLEIGQHQLYVLCIALMHEGEFGQAALAACGLVLQHVILEGLTADKLTATTFAKPFRSRFTSFEFGHGTGQKRK
jgi:hypothetical protein